VGEHEVGELGCAENACAVTCGCLVTFVVPVALVLGALCWLLFVAVEVIA
jgi:hypothetical protein